MAPPAPSEATVVTTHDTLQAALDVFNGPDSTIAPSGGRQQLKALAERHKQAAAKAGLLVLGAGGGGGGSVSPAELRGVISSLEQSTIALCGCCHGFTAGAGPSLKSSLRRLCGGVVGPTQELAGRLLQSGGDAEGLRTTVGCVWAACDELTRGPLDNAGRLFRQLADAMAGIKGAAKELDELCEASRQELRLGGPGGGGEGSPGANGTTRSGCSCRDGDEEGEGAEASAAGGPGGRGAASASTTTTATSSQANAEPRGRAEKSRAAGEEAEGEEQDEEQDGEQDGETDSDDFRDLGTLSSEVELRTAEAGVRLLGAAQAVVRLVSRPLLAGPVLAVGPTLEEWESLVWHGAKLRSSCEALVACLYPPHDELDELSGESEAVATTLELMLDELPEDVFGSSGEGEGEREDGQLQQLRRQVAAVRAEVEVAAGQMAEELSRRGRLVGGG